MKSKNKKSKKNNTDLKSNEIEKSNESIQKLSVSETETDTSDLDFDDMEMSDLDYYEDYGEDAGFESVSTEKDTKKSYQIDYTVISSQEIVAIQNQHISHIVGILGCPIHIASALLIFYKWNKEVLIEQFMDNQKGVLEKSHITMESNIDSILIKQDSFSCEICCNQYTEPITTIGLICNHRYCIDCYRYFVTQKINDEGQSMLKCPGPKCLLIIDEITLQSIVIPSIFQKYQSLLMKSYVDDHKYIKWCPAPNCDYAIECKVLSSQLHEIVPSVTCKCGHSFCFGCRLPDHQPCICELVKLWIKKCEDDSETSNWISANTKECSKCSATIEKNGGCNHMICQKCKYEFCWVCIGPWKDHGSQYYNCNRYDDQAGVQARTAQEQSRFSLKRYLHYYNRFANHENSAKLDKDLFDKTAIKMDALQHSSGLSWIEVQFLQKAVHVLLQSRMTLKWTYAFAYYLERDNMTELFEDNQRDLEMAVEQLSELLENNVEPGNILQLKQQVTDKSVYVASRREVVLEDTAKGLLEDRWKYGVPILKK